MHYAVIYFIFIFLGVKVMVWILKLWILGRGAARRCVTLHPTPRPPAHIISLGLGFLLETLVRRDGETQDRTDAEPMPRTTQA